MQQKEVVIVIILVIGGLFFLAQSAIPVKTTGQAVSNGDCFDPCMEMMRNFFWYQYAAQWPSYSLGSNGAYTFKVHPNGPLTPGTPIMEIWPCPEGNVDCEQSWCSITLLAQLNQPANTVYLPCSENK